MDDVQKKHDFIDTLHAEAKRLEAFTEAELEKVAVFFHLMKEKATAEAAPVPQEPQAAAQTTDTAAVAAQTADPVLAPAAPVEPVQPEEPAAAVDTASTQTNTDEPKQD
jgi:hypothetical protein